MFLSLAGALGAPIAEGDALYASLRAALLAYGDPLVPLRMVGYADARFRCRLAVKVLAEYESQLTRIDDERTAP